MLFSCHDKMSVMTKLSHKLLFLKTECTNSSDRNDGGQILISLKFMNSLLRSYYNVSMLPAAV